MSNHMLPPAFYVLAPIVLTLTTCGVGWGWLGFASAFGPCFAILAAVAFWGPRMSNLTSVDFYCKMLTPQ